MSEHDTTQAMTTPFAASIMLKAASGDDDEEWIVSGPAASLERDYDGEVIEKAGLLDALKQWCSQMRGHIDYEHGYGRSVAAGKPDPDLIIAKGIEVTEVDGRPWVTAKLLKGKALAEKVWRHLRAGGELGFSLEGKGSFHPQDRTRRLVTAIHRLTIAPIPKGFDQTMQVGRPLPALALVAKALVDSVEAEEPDWAGDLYSGGVDLSECRWVKAADAPVEGDMLNQDQAHYRPHGSEWACRNCAHWDGDHCDKVQGTILPGGNCDYFELPKGAESRGAGDASVLVVQVAPRVEKALTTGAGIVGEGDTGGKALRTQSIEKRVRPATYGGKRRRRPSREAVRRLVEKAVTDHIGALKWGAVGGVEHAKAAHGRYAVVKNPLGGHMAAYRAHGLPKADSLGIARSVDEAKKMCTDHHKALNGARMLPRA